MPSTFNRRDWLKQSSLAALGLGIGIPSFGKINDHKVEYERSEMINLGSNENPYGISPAAKEAIIGMIGKANRYQVNVPVLNSFRKQLANHYNLNAENILVTPGSGEALALLARHFSKGNIVTAIPSYTALPNTAKKIGTKVIEVPLRDDKVHNLQAMLSAITDETSLVNIVNPANPTGTLLSADAVENFCREASKKTMVLVDEAYLDFVKGKDSRSMLSLIDQNENIIVMRTFSKVYGLAGLRTGWIAAHPSTIKKLEANFFSHTIYAVSNVALAAAIAALGDKDHVKMTIAKNEEARSFTLTGLIAAGIRAIPSETNFIYFNADKYNGDLFADLKGRNLLIRGNMADKGKWLRVSIGTMQEMKIFNKTITELYSS